ncbi:MAG: MFS transporter [Actinomycetales bacterium]
MSSGATSLWRLPAVRHLVVVSVLGFASFCLTLASLPLWAVRGGASAATAGLVTTVMLVTTVVTQALVPAMIVRFGSGPALALGLLLLGAPAPLYALSSHLTLLLVVSAVRGTGFALLTVIGATLTGAVAPAARHGEAVGLYGLAIAVPNLVGIPAGVALTQTGHFSLAATLAASPVLALPSAVRVGRRSDLAADASGAAGEATAEAGGAVGAVSHRTVIGVTLRPSLVLLVVTAAGGGLVTFLPIERSSGSLATVALLVFGTTAALARWRAGVLVDRAGPRLLLPAALTAAVTGLFGVALCLLGGRSFDPVLLVAAALFGLGYGGIQNLTLVVAFARAGSGGAATASALWNASFDFGTALGAFGVGALAETGLGLPWALAVSAGLMLLGGPLAVGLGTTGRRFDAG